MDEERLRESAERDQLWASLRALQPEIIRFAEGHFDNTDRERQLVQVLSKIVVSELVFRAARTEPETDPSL